MGFLVILFIGWLVALGVGKAVTMLLRKAGFDRFSNRMGLARMEQRVGMNLDAPLILGKIAFWFIFLIFLVPAADSLGLPTVSSTLGALVGYLPNVFVAVLVLFLGTLLGHFAGDAVRGATAAANVGNPKLFGNITRWSIVFFAGLIALEQLQIAPALINVLFTAIISAAALAFALAFGLGGREFAQRWLARGESSLLANRPYDPNQIVQQARSDLAHSEQMGQQYASHVEPMYTPPQPASSVSSYGTQTTAPQKPAGKQQAVPPATNTPTNYDQPNRPPIPYI